MAETSSFSLASHLYLTESWFEAFESRGFVLTLVALAFVLCSAAAGRSKTSANERESWRRPSTYPLSVPIIGHFLMMAWDSPEFLSAVASVSLRPHRLYSGPLLTILI